MVRLLENKVALVAGASSGIGRACAIAMAASGAKLVVAARRETEGQTLMANYAIAMLPEVVAAHAGVVPMGRMGKLHEVGNAVIWRCSDASSFTTGHALPTDGGLVAS